jgi:signal transduction histidine kinase
MTLRFKILATLGLLCVTLIGLSALVIWRVSLSSYAKLEQQTIQRDLERVQKALEADIEQLVIANRGYAYWNDTQAFVLGEYPDYPIDNGLNNNIFLEVDIDLFIIANKQGDTIYNRSFSAEVEDSVALDEATLATLRPLLTRQAADVAEGSGILTLPRGTAIFSRLPILDNLAQGTMVGTLLMVRYLSEARLQAFNETILVSLHTDRADDPALPQAVKDGVAALHSASDFFIRSTGNRITGYMLLSDASGKPSIIWSIEAQRTIYQQGLRNVFSLLTALAIISVLATLMIAVLLERTLLSRLAKLSRGVRKISETGSVSQRINLSGKDELSLLAKDINGMLGAIEQHSEALKKSNQELEQFAYIASHDLQEPLRKVQAFSDRLASKYADKLDDDGKLYIARMQDAAGRMRVLIQDLLTYSRVKTKGQEFVAVDLNEIIKGVVSDLEVRLEQSGGRIEVGDLPTVQADPMQMRQVFQNLIGNALKFKKPDTAPVVKVLAKQGSNRTGHHVHSILIQDNGIGFEQQYAERIFEIFQRLHGRGDYEGTGMGLAIVKKILERHVGSIRAESELGKGTRFILTLPRHEEPGHEENPAIPAQDAAEDGAKKIVTKKAVAEKTPRINLAEVKKELA